MNHSTLRAALGTALAAGLIAAPLAASTAFAVDAAPHAAGTSPIIINEAYLSGGSAGAAYKNKFIELYNASETAVSLSGWSIQYRSGAGTAAPNGVAALSGSIPAKGYYLIKGGTNSSTSTAADLPAADADAPGINPSGTTGTVI